MPRTRSAEYRARRRVRHAMRRVRMSEYADYQTMLRLTPGYADMLERLSDYEHTEALAMEFDEIDGAPYACDCPEQRTDYTFHSGTRCTECGGAAGFHSDALSDATRPPRTPDAFEPSYEGEEP